MVMSFFFLNSCTYIGNTEVVFQCCLNDEKGDPDPTRFKNTCLDPNI